MAVMRPSWPPPRMPIVLPGGSIKRDPGVPPLSGHGAPRQEGFDEIADWFETLARAGKSRAGRFQKALDAH